MLQNYEKMSFAELRAYVVENRNDIQAVRFLMSKRNPNSTKYPTPITEAQMQEQRSPIRRKVNEDFEV